MEHIKFIYTFILIAMLLACHSETASSQAKGQGKADHTQVTQRAQSSSLEFDDHSVLCLEIGNVIDFECLKGIIKVEIEESEKRGNKVFALKKNGRTIIEAFPALDPRMGSYTSILREINLLDSQFENQKGIKVGSTVEKFSEAYPKAYYYYDLSRNHIVLTDEGHGPRFIVEASALKDAKNTNIGRITKEQISPDAKIDVIRIMRSKIENQDAMANKEAEEREIVEEYLATLEGKYFLKEYSERYYKIHQLQGDFYISECREDNCDSRGKIEGAQKTNGYIPLDIEGIEGEMVPTWTINLESNGEVSLYVHDYNAVTDTWEDKVYYKMSEEIED